MTYAVQQDLIDRFGESELIELTDRADPATGAIVSSVLDGALNDADAAIDAYISKRYDLPLGTTPPLLLKLAGDLARYFLHDEDAPERVRDAYNDAIKFLKDISAGRADLDVGGSQPTPAGDTVMTSGPARVHTADTLEGY